MSTAFLNVGFAARNLDKVVASTDKSIGKVVLAKAGTNGQGKKKTSMLVLVDSKYPRTEDGLQSALLVLSSATGIKSWFGKWVEDDRHQDNVTRFIEDITPDVPQAWVRGETAPPSADAQAVQSEETRAAKRTRFEESKDLHAELFQFIKDNKVESFDDLALKDAESKFLLSWVGYTLESLPDAVAKMVDWLKAAAARD